MRKKEVATQTVSALLSSILGTTPMPISQRCSASICLCRRVAYGSPFAIVTWSEITITLEDVANQLLLPILGDVDSSAIKFSLDKEAVQAELKKGMSGNVKLSHWVGAFSKAFDVVRRIAFVAL
ncbi:hypothetical protein SO802_002794 [Lithocarpus litseifolius]|uniref:Uncharacterized protein n=1 Tax=Lithocarpus litseifolius TaxID=425828 RepID=A0AAW2E297_9ROSI